MNQLILGCAALSAIIGAQAIREAAVTERVADTNPPPLAPSAGAAPFASLGYRELVADLLYARLRTYIGGGGDTQAAPMAQLVEAAVTLDPGYRRMYDFGVPSMKVAKHGVDQDIHLRAVKLLEKGLEVFPDDWRIAQSIGQIYMLDLTTEDASLRREWDQRAVKMFELAAGKPNAPALTAATIATLRTRLGQEKRARDSIREMLLVSGDTSARDQLLRKLAELEATNEAALAAELLEERNKFDRAWERDRPAVPATTYVIVGKPLGGGAFDLGELALGGRVLLEPPPPPLEPLGP